MCEVQDCRVLQQGLPKVTLETSQVRLRFGPSSIPQSPLTPDGIAWRQRPFCLLHIESNRVALEDALSSGVDHVESDISKHLSTFTSIHRQSLLQAAYGAVCNFQPDDKVDNFDFDAHYIRFNLRRRHNSGSDSGNPSKLFRIVAGAIRPREEMYARLRKDITGKLTGNKFHEHLVEFDQHYRNTMADSRIGVVPCLFVVANSDEHMFVGYMLLHDRLLMYARANNWDVPEPQHERWFERLQQKVELGHVFHPMKGYENKMQDIGTMVKTKGKWTWVAFTDEELELYGYHRILSCIVY